MRLRIWHIVLALSLFTVSCRGPRLIPRDELSSIFHDIFLRDQQIRMDNSHRRIADTTLVYESIFQAYGYNTDDYLFTMSQYIREPEKLSKVFARTSERLTREAGEVGKEIRFEEWQKRYMAIYLKKIDTSLLPQVPPALLDTAFFRLVDDQVRYFPPPLPELDTLVLNLDSLNRQAPKEK